MTSEAKPVRTVILSNTLMEHYSSYPNRVMREYANSVEIVIVVVFRTLAGKLQRAALVSELIHPDACSYLSRSLDTIRPYCPTWLPP